MRSYIVTPAKAGVQTREVFYEQRARNETGYSATACPPRRRGAEYDGFAFKQRPPPVTKIAGNRAKAYLANPDTAHHAMLLYGPDATQVAARRNEVVRTLLGGDDDPFRLARLENDQIKRDPAALLDEVNGLSFGGGSRVIVLNMATDAATAGLKTALEEIQSGTTLIVTAGVLAASSKLRKLFEGAGNAGAVPLYPLEGTALEAEFSAMLRTLGAPPIDSDARGALALVLSGFQHGEAERFAETLALYTLHDDAVTTEAVSACAPPAAEADFDETIQAVAQGMPRRIPSLIDRLDSQGASLAGLIRVLSLYFQRLHRAQAAMEGGADAQAAMSKLRPPIFWKLKDVFASQLRAWPRPGVEEALNQLGGLEADLRSGKTLPDRALIERVLMRIAMSAPGSRQR